MATRKTEETGEPAQEELTQEELTAAGLKAPGEPETEDVVQMASVNKDGEPDQSAGFKFLDPDVGNALLALQKESQQAGKDMVREKGPEVLREAAKAKAAKEAKG